MAPTRPTTAYGRRSERGGQLTQCEVPPSTSRLQIYKAQNSRMLVSNSVRNSLKNLFSPKAE